MIALALAAALVAADPAWHDCTPTLIASVPGYAPYGPGERGVAGLAVAADGRLYTGLMCAPFGLWASDDGGATWRRADDGTVAGTAPRSGSLIADPADPRHLIALRSKHPGPGTSAWTGDGGTTWTAIVNTKREPYAGYEGFVHGLALWSGDRPGLILALDRPESNLWRSADAGTTWQAQPTGVKGTKAERACIDSGVQTQGYLKAKDPIRGYGLASDGAVLLGRDSGLYRIAADGTAAKVAELHTAALHAVRDGTRLWWLCDEGLAASDDHGTTWTIVGTPPHVLRKGPYLSGDQRMLAVGADGICLSRDRGLTWTVVAPHRLDAAAWRADQEGAFTRTDYAWDARRGWLFSAGLAGTLARLDVR